MAATGEVFDDQPTGVVTSGGTTTSDTAFTVTPADSFPAASSAVTPNTVFRIIDPANTGEIMLVTSAPGGAGSGQSWTVTRGAEGSTAVAHAANWTCVQVISSGTLGLFAQNQLTGQALYTCNNTTTAVDVFSYNPLPQDAPAAGVAYHFVAFGTIGTANTTTDAEPIFLLTWNGTTLATMQADSGQPAIGTAMTSAGWWLEGAVVCLSSTSMVAGMNFMTHKTTTAYQMVTVTDDASSVMAGVTVSGATGPLVLSANWHTAESTNLLTGSGFASRAS